MPERTRAHHRLTMAAAGVGVLAAGTSAALLLRGPGPTPDGAPSPAPPSGAAPMSSDEAYLRQVCGKDFDPEAEAGACLVRTSLPPSQLAKMLEDLRRDGGAEKP
ncbi:hypothetical protein COUCH_23970 [Couchioplanes caeruleus]|uniref:hypothetical protein n=1 Tax=Couchioplanes caeruleus TaxID=56438 RepID=UPI0020BF4EAB|nr:hypothetical protein [Couchioplanes caeruleus]UQU62093.1 hypothetical protein COUCH_23970 [Couchioplanes caeruleus]